MRHRELALERGQAIDPARGEELALPNLGLETVHHVHADDVAQIEMRRQDAAARANLVK